MPGRAIPWKTGAFQGDTRQLDSARARAHCQTRAPWHYQLWMADKGWWVGAVTFDKSCTVPKIHGTDYMRMFSFWPEMWHTTMSKCLQQREMYKFVQMPWLVLELQQWCGVILLIKLWDQVVRKIECQFSGICQIIDVDGIEHAYGHILVPISDERGWEPNIWNMHAATFDV